MIKRHPHLFIILSALCFTAMAGNMKALAYLSPFFIIGVRQIILTIGLLIFLPSVFNQSFKLQSKDIAKHYILRTTISFLALCLTCWGLGYVSLVEAKIIGLTETILIGLISILWLANRVNKIEWLLLLIPIIGGGLALFN